MIFADEKTISLSDIGGLVRALSNFSRKTGKWDWTILEIEKTKSGYASLTAEIRQFAIIPHIYKAFRR